MPITYQPFFDMIAAWLRYENTDEVLIPWREIDRHFGSVHGFVVVVGRGYDLRCEQQGIVLQRR